MDVSQETEEETDLRLRRVVALADLVVHDGIWCFAESPASNPPSLSDRTLAVVYWGCPHELLPDVVSVIRQLSAHQRTAVS